VGRVPDRSPPPRESEREREREKRVKVPVQVMKAYRSGGGIAPAILKLSTR